MAPAIARAARAYAQGRFDEVEAISTAILKEFSPIISTRSTCSACCVVVRGDLPRR